MAWGFILESRATLKMFNMVYPTRLTNDLIMDLDRSKRVSGS